MSRSLRNILLLFIVATVVLSLLWPFLNEHRMGVVLRVQNQTGEPVDVGCWHDAPDNIIFTISVDKDETIDYPLPAVNGTTISLNQFPTSFGFTWKGESSGKELEGKLINWAISPDEGGRWTIVLTKKDIVILKNS